MLREDVVREMLARLERSEQVKAIARDLGIEKKTIKRWRQRGASRPPRRRGAAHIRAEASPGPAVARA